jgi:type I restriction enzyme S subunit
MADLTSLYQKKPKRDLSIQACVDCLNKLALEFPDEFSNGYFTDYLDISGGTQPPKTQFIHEPKDGYIRFLQIRDFASDSTPTYIPIAKNNKTCEENDIVLGRYGASVGKILTGKSGAYNVACAKIVFLNENEVDRDYLFYWLHSSYFQNFLTSISRSAQGGFNKNDISRIHFNIPSIELQKKIVSLFKAIDKDLLEDRKPNLLNFKGSELELRLVKLMSKFLNIITEKEDLQNELTHQLDLIKQLRHSFLREAMQGKLLTPVTSSGVEKQETGHDLLAKIKAEKAKLIAEKKLKKEKELPPITDEEIPFEIPKHWAWCRLGEICTLITDGKHGDCKNESDSGYYFLSAKDIQNGQFVYDNARQITYEDFLETHRRTNLEPGDLCIVNTGATIGKSAFAPEDEKTRKTTFQKSVAVIKVIRELTNMRFVENFIINETPRLLKKSRGSAINNLLLGDMRNILFPLPPLHEQEQIVAKLEELMAFCDGLEQSIKESQGYNEMLLQQVLREAL